MKMAVALRTLALLLLDEDENENRRQDRSCWVRPWVANRLQFGAFHSLFYELRKDERSFKEFIRMDVNQFDFLVEKLTPKIIKVDTFMRDSILDQFYFFFVTQFELGHFRFIHLDKKYTLHCVCI